MTITTFVFGFFCGGLLFDQLWRWLYRATGKLLTEQGEYIAELEDAIAMEARQGGDGETWLHPKDDSAGLKGIAHD